MDEWDINGILMGYIDINGVYIYDPLTIYGILMDMTSEVLILNG